MNKLLFFLPVFIFFSCSEKSSGDGDIDISFENRTCFVDDSIRAIVDSVYNSLSPDERAAQIHGIRPALIVENGKLSLAKCRKLIPYGVGHISQFACMQDLKENELRDFTADLQAYLLNETRSKIPAIFHEEAITGFAAKGATVFPQQLGVACTWNPSLVREKNEMVREAMRSCGSTMALSPMVDVIRTQHFNRVEESYGEDAYLSAAFAVDFVKGLQGDDLTTGVAACSKHFLGYGGGSNNPTKVLIEEILLPHEAAIRCADLKTVMTGYHKYNGVNAVANIYFIKDILRNYLDFDGVMVSDYFAIASSKKKDDYDYITERAVQALSAGTDIELCDGIAYPVLPDLIKQGKVNEKDFENAVKRSLALKVRLGLFSPNNELYDKGNISLDSPESRNIAYELASQSVVLLKNNGILPLKESHSKIALVGPNANSFWAMTGDYTYQSMYAFFQGGKIDPTSPKIYTFKEGLERIVKSPFILRYEKGCDWSNSDEWGIDKISDGDSRIAGLQKMLVSSSDKVDRNAAFNICNKSDVIIAAMGENATLCGEGRIRKGIRLPGDQEKFVEDLISTGTPVILVVFGGRAQVLSEKIRNGAMAILSAWYPGEEGGNAVADIIMGKKSPSGKLCVSYPSDESREPLCYNYGEPVSERVAYPFGHGLSYSNFKYTLKDCTTKAELGNDIIRIAVEITNDGDYDASEVVQLYVSPDFQTDKFRPIQLKGFTRVDLMKKESKVITFKLKPEMMEYYDDGKWVSEPGNFIFKIGSSSVDIRCNIPVSIVGEKSLTDNRRVIFSSVTIK